MLRSAIERRQAVSALLVWIALSAPACGDTKAEPSYQMVGVLTSTPPLGSARGWDPQLANYIPSDGGVFDLTRMLVAIAKLEPGAACATSIPFRDTFVLWEDDTSGWYVAEELENIDGNDGRHPGDVSSSPQLCKPLAFTTRAVGNDVFYAESGSAPAGCFTNIAYSEGQIYTFTARMPGDLWESSLTHDFWVRATAVPPLEPTSVEFLPSIYFDNPVDSYGARLARHDGSALTVSWGASAGSVFVTLHRILFVGDLQSSMSALNRDSWAMDDDGPVLDNAPRDFLHILAATNEMETSSVTLPADAFAETGLYVLSLTRVNRHAPEDTTRPTGEYGDAEHNLSAGSAALVGAATLFVFFVD